MPVRMTPRLLHGRMGWGWDKPRAWWPPLRWLGEGWLAQAVVRGYSRATCALWGHEDWQWHAWFLQPTITTAEGVTLSVEVVDSSDVIRCGWCCARLTGCICRRKGKVNDA